MSLLEIFTAFSVFCPTSENGSHFVSELFLTCNCSLQYEKPVSMVMDDQLLDVLAADTDSGSVGFSVLFLS